MAQEGRKLRKIRGRDAYRLDLVVGGSVLLELKAVERLLPIHEAQVVTYLRLSQLQVGLLVNFNVTVLRNASYPSRCWRSETSFPPPSTLSALLCSAARKPLR